MKIKSPFKPNTNFYLIMSAGIFIFAGCILIAELTRIKSNTDILHSDDIKKVRAFHRQCLKKQGISNVNDYGQIGSWRISCTYREKPDETQNNN
jgi:hypothetical protein